jgi:hypothetical protein
MVSTLITIRTATAISITVLIIIILLSRQIINLAFCSAGRPLHSSTSIPVIQPQDNPTDKAYAVIVQFHMFVQKVRYRRVVVVWVCQRWIESKLARGLCPCLCVCEMDG